MDLQRGLLPRSLPSTSSSPTSQIGLYFHNNNKIAFPLANHATTSVLRNPTRKLNDMKPLDNDMIEYNTNSYVVYVRNSLVLGRVIVAAFIWVKTSSRTTNSSWRHNSDDALVDRGRWIEKKDRLAQASHPGNSSQVGHELVTAINHCYRWLITREREIAWIYFVCIAHMDGRR